MREIISAFLKDLGVPDGTVGLEMLGEALEKSMSLIQQRRRINLTVLCAALGDKYGQSSESIDRAMRRALDFAVYRTGQAPNVLMSEVIGYDCYSAVSLRSFLYAAAGWLLKHEGEIEI